VRALLRWTFYGAVIFTVVALCWLAAIGIRALDAALIP
jgi:hypothetical protein